MTHVPTLVFHEYHVFVMDPKYIDRGAGFTVKAVNVGHAEKQAKDGYTGLLGNYEEVQKRLKVTVTPS